MTEFEVNKLLNVLNDIADALNDIADKMNHPTEESPKVTTEPQPKPEKKEKKWKEWTPEEDKILVDCIVLGFGYEAIQANIFPYRTVGAVKFRYYNLKNNVNG